MSNHDKVWDLLFFQLELTSDAIVIKTFKAKCEGRGAFLAIWNRYWLGHMADKAEEILSSRYHTKIQIRTFRTLVLIHQKAHIIMEGLVELGYFGIDKRSKVCHLMNSIKTKTLDAAKAQIMANANLQIDFNACVTLFKDFITQERSANGNERQVAALNVTGGSGSNSNDRYVLDPEWQALPKDERTKIIAARKAVREAKKAGGGGGGGSNGKKKGGASKKSKQSKWMKKEVKRQVAAALSAQRGDNDGEELPMKTDDGDGHKMRQASKKKLGSN